MCMRTDDRMVLCVDCSADVEEQQIRLMNDRKLIGMQQTGSGDRAVSTRPVDPGLCSFHSSHYRIPLLVI